MRDVAALAGVSAKTVSRVFNDDQHVTPETRRRVEEAMRELNYVPNALATTFRSGRSSVIGVAVPDVIDPFFAAIVRGADDAAQNRGMSTLVTSLGNRPDRERSALESLLSRQLSGLVVAPVGPDQSWMKRWVEHTPIVFVDRPPIGLSADVFMEDDVAGAHLATSHLIAHGHTKIAFVGDTVDVSTEKNRLEGYCRALSDAGIPQDEGLVVVHASDTDRAAAAVSRLWARPHPPTALFSANARCSMLLIPALRGKAVAFVGFGDFPMADVLHPSLSVIDQNPTQLGLSAANRIFERIDHPNRRLRRRNLRAVTLVERESCRIPAAAPREPAVVETTTVG